MYITPPFNYLSDTFVSFTKLCDNKNLEPWINANIQIVAQLSKIDVWNKYGQKVEQMYNQREYLKNILSCIDFNRLCNVIKQFPELNHNIAKEGISFPFLLGSRSFKR